MILKMLHFFIYYNSHKNMNYNIVHSDKVDKLMSYNNGDIFGTYMISGLKKYDFC